jgi:hypothetical protein
MTRDQAPSPARTKCAHMRVDNLPSVAVIRVARAESFVPHGELQPYELEICALCLGWIHAVTAFGLPVNRVLGVPGSAATKRRGPPRK